MCEGLRIQRIVLSTLGRFLAAAMRGGHPHLLAVVLHRQAAGTFLGIHLYVGHSAGHHWRQIRHQKQDGDPELAHSFHALLTKIGQNETFDSKKPINKVIRLSLKIVDPLSEVRPFMWF